LALGPLGLLAPTGHLQAIAAAAKHRGSCQQQQEIAPGGVAG